MILIGISIAYAAKKSNLGGKPRKNLLAPCGEGGYNERNSWRAHQMNGGNRRVGGKRLSCRAEDSI
jgi:hypothetical protein